MKQIEPGCWAMVVPSRHGIPPGDDSKNLFGMVVQIGDVVSPETCLMGPKCGCPVWELPHHFAAECALMRIDGYDGDGREWYEDIRREVMEELDA